MLRTAFTGEHGLALTPANVYGVLSVVFWALVVVVTLKYIMLIMRADNNGEGGILALTALVSRGLDRNNRRRWWLIGFGIFGAAMFYGDGMITPAISVLSAVEGLEIVTPALHPFVVPVTLVIIVALFAIQKRGTASVGAVLRAGDVRVLRRAGAARRLGDRRRSRRSSPRSIRTTRWPSSSSTPVPAFLSLGAVVLAVTGTRGAVRGHGALRAQADPARVALVRDARAGDQLLRAGRADPRRSGRRQEPVLPARAVVGAHPAGRARHLRDRHRVAGGDLGHVLAVARRRSRWATARGCRSSTRPSARSARSTCRSSTGRCSSPSSCSSSTFRKSDNLAAAYGIAVTLRDADRLDPDLRGDGAAVEVAAVGARS